VLLYSFCGCDTSDVLAAIGLSLSDLFDKPLATCLPPIRGGFNARELLELLEHESSVAAMLAEQATRTPLTADEAARLLTAAGRIATARALTHG
jgi:hypothetical protein